MTQTRAETLRQLVATYWKPLIALGAGIPAALSVLKTIGVPVEKLAPFFASTSPVGRTGMIVLGLMVLLVIRFPPVAVAFTRWILGPPPRPQNLPRIFRGPRPYGIQDRAIFPGRQAETEDSCQLAQEHPFLILEGESGSGKSSFLKAALLPRLRETMQVVECRANDDPMGKLRSALLGEPYVPGDQQVHAEMLLEAIERAQGSRLVEAASAAPLAPILICIDQFEQLFVTVDGETRTAFLGALRVAIEKYGVRLIISIRSDFIDLLSRLARQIDPKQRFLDLGSYYTLRAFSGEQAEGVLDTMLKPLQSSDPVLRHQVEQFSKALVRELLQPPRDKRLYQYGQTTVLPVDLQTIGMVIESMGASYFSSAGLRKLGGKAGLLRAYIEDAKTFAWRRTGVARDRTLLILRRLISPANTTLSETPESIGAALSCSADQVSSVLDAFAEKYLVVRLPSESVPVNSRSAPSARYELMHEHLVRVLAETPEPFLQRAKDAEERMNYWLRRTLRLREPEPAGGRRTWRDRMASMLAQPIPISETLNLWRFSRSAVERQMLRRNALAFALRTTPFLIVGLIAAIWAYSRSPAAEQWLVQGKIGGLSSEELRLVSVTTLPSSTEIRPDGTFQHAVVFRDRQRPVIWISAPNRASVMIDLDSKQLLSHRLEFDDRSKRVLIVDPIELNERDSKPYYPPVTPLPRK